MVSVTYGVGVQPRGGLCLGWGGLVKDRERQVAVGAVVTRRCAKARDARDESVRLIMWCYESGLERLEGW